MCNIGMSLGVINIPEEDPIYALREWGLEKGKLVPAIWVGEGFKWNKRKPSVAECYNNFNINNHEPAGSLFCSCGIYAVNYHNREDRVEAFITGRAYGVVKLWGNVVVHDDGYRAQYGQPVATSRLMWGLQKFSIRLWRKRISNSKIRAHSMLEKEKEQPQEETQVFAYTSG